MAESPDGRGVLIFGGAAAAPGIQKNILELRAGADSWNILDVSMQSGRKDHVVIPLPTTTPTTTPTTAPTTTPTIPPTTTTPPFVGIYYI